MESEKSINIDTPIDLELCKLIMKKMIFSYIYWNWIWFKGFIKMFIIN